MVEHLLCKLKVAGSIPAGGLETAFLLRGQSQYPRPGPVHSPPLQSQPIRPHLQMVQAKPKAKAKAKSSARPSAEATATATANPASASASVPVPVPVPSLSSYSTYLTALRACDFTVFAALPFSHFPSLADEFFSLRGSDGRSLLYSLSGEPSSFACRFLDWALSFPSGAALLLAQDVYGQSVLHYWASYDQTAIICALFEKRYNITIETSAKTNQQQQQQQPRLAAVSFSLLHELSALMGMRDLSGKLAYHFVQSPECLTMIGSAVTEAKRLIDQWPSAEEREQLRQSALYLFEYSVPTDSGDSLLHLAARRNLVQLARQAVELPVQLC